MYIRYENIPAQLTRLDRWVVWHYDERSEKMTKLPYVPARGKKRPALINVPSTWGCMSRQKTHEVYIYCHVYQSV